MMTNSVLKPTILAEDVCRLVTVTVTETVIVTVTVTVTVTTSALVGSALGCWVNEVWDWLFMFLQDVLLK
jgi:hypothetical protein